jgi:hypothetical protein
MIEKLLMFASAAVVFVLGLLHLIYTFWGSKLRPRDRELQAQMGRVSPVISNETTMWRCWIGVNSTHSMSLLLFGVMYGFLALAHPEILFRSAFLIAVGFATLCAFFVLAKLYFFSIPFAGITISLICFIASVVASRFS